MKTRITTALLLAAGLIVGCNETSKEINNAEDVREIAAEDTAVLYEEDNLMAGSVLEADEEEFKEVDFNAPEIEDAELNEAGVDLRGAESFVIYSLGEDVMFDTDKAQIRDNGAEKLQSIVADIKERNMEGSIRVYGFTDARASEAYNKELGKERAQAVQNWLLENSKFDQSRMKIVSMGEQYPEATNETAEGRQQNRRVEIVVVKNPTQ